MSFNSRPSCDGRRYADIFRTSPKCFNSRPSCDGRPEAVADHPPRDVSIHARLATGDFIPQSIPLGLFFVSIHARLATGDRSVRQLAASATFQFTPVLRRATASIYLPLLFWLFQFTPVLRRATRTRLTASAIRTFQFTPVLRRATRARPTRTRLTPVSIHARLATGDRRKTRLSATCRQIRSTKAATG